MYNGKSSRVASDLRTKEQSYSIRMIEEYIFVYIGSKALFRVRDIETGMEAGDFAKYFGNVKFFVQTFQHVEAVDKVAYIASYDNFIYTNLAKKNTYSENFSANEEEWLFF